MPDDLQVADEFLIDPTCGPIEHAPMRISDALARTINTAEEREVPMVFAYVDENRAIRQSFRGSIHVHGPLELAFWNRDPKGGFVRALAAGYKFVCATFRERDTPRVLQFHGRARLIEDEEEARRIWNESPELERTLTHGMNGVGVVIDLDRVQGLDQPVQGGAWQPLAMARASRAAAPRGSHPPSSPAPEQRNVSR